MKGGGTEFQPLTSFARTKAKKYETENLARTYVLEDLSNNRIAAFITLVCSEVVSKERLFDPDQVDFPYGHYPAVKIARLLVDSRYRGQNGRGLGTALVDFALGVARNEICPAVGCRFVVVDSKAASVGFYSRKGFTMIDTLANKDSDSPVLYIDLHKAGA